MEDRKIDIMVPHLGEGIQKVELALWHVEEGEAVLEGQDLCELVTDKVSFNVPSPHAGTLIKKHLSEEQSTVIGSRLAQLITK